MALSRCGVCGDCEKFKEGVQVLNQTYKLVGLMKLLRKSGREKEFEPMCGKPFNEVLSEAEEKLEFMKRLPPDEVFICSSPAKASNWSLDSPQDPMHGKSTMERVYNAIKRYTEGTTFGVKLSINHKMKDGPKIYYRIQAEPQDKDDEKEYKKTMYALVDSIGEIPDIMYTFSMNIATFETIIRVIN